MTANTVVLCWAIDLLVFGLIFSFYQIILIDQHTAPMLIYGIFALFNTALVAKLRKYGVANLNFELHERALNTFLEPPETWSHTILGLLDESAARSNELELLVRHIDEAPGPVERQDRRAEAKAWLKENRAKLSPEDREYVRIHLGYLH